MVKFSTLYDKHYKKAIVIPLIVLILSLGYLTYFYLENGDIIKRDVSLTGGTSITVFGNYSAKEIYDSLSPIYPDLDTTALSDNLGRSTGVTILVAEKSPEEIKEVIENELGIVLDETNSSVEFTGSELGKDFYVQLSRALLFAFLLVALVIFFKFGENKPIKIYSSILAAIAARLTFPVSNQLGILIFGVVIGLYIWGFITLKTKKEAIWMGLLFILFVVSYFYPLYWLIFPITILLMFLFAKYSVSSILIITSVISNIINTIALVNLLGIKISSAGIVAFLMIIGYSVDDNILLTTKLNRRKGHVNEAIFESFRTAIMMVGTSIFAVGVALLFLYRFDSILNQIFMIIMLGLGFDIINTWMGYSGIIKWYLERKK